MNGNETGELFNVKDYGTYLLQDIGKCRYGTKDKSEVC